jgi:hypothetical protein
MYRHLTTTFEHPMFLCWSAGERHNVVFSVLMQQASDVEGKPFARSLSPDLNHLRYSVVPMVSKTKDVPLCNQLVSCL